MKLRAVMVLFLLLIAGGKALAVTLDDIQSDVLCTCGCGMVLKNCECGTAAKLREEINQMISSGMTKEEIIAELQSTYGKEILANPPKEGVFAGLWYYPVVLISAGLIVLYVILKRRRSEWYADPDEIINEDYEDLELEH